MDKTIKLLSSMTNKALDDGIITEDERALLKSVFDDLKDYNWWLQEALSDGVIDLSEEKRLKNLLYKIYENTWKTVIVDDVVTDDERALLDHLGECFCIDEKIRKSIESKRE